MINEPIELKGILWEDTVNYKKIGTTLMFPHCSFKCEKECGMKICQNNSLPSSYSMFVHLPTFISNYMNNPLTEAIILQGLEPFDSLDSIYALVQTMNEFNCTDDLVIYTGYNKEEINPNVLEYFKAVPKGSVIIKWGRYIPNQESHFDKVLGVSLASDNQYGEKIK